MSTAEVSSVLKQLYGRLGGIGSEIRMSTEYVALTILPLVLLSDSASSLHELLSAASHFLIA